jgi:hypothetical protein
MAQQQRQRQQPTHTMNEALAALDGGLRIL